MKKKRNKSKKSKKIKNKVSKLKKSKKIYKKSKKIITRKTKRKRKRKFKNIKKIVYPKIKKSQNESLALKLVKLQLLLKPQLKLKINFSLEKYIQGFFDKISEIISNYKILKHDEKRRLQLEKIDNERKVKIAIEKKKKKMRF